MNFSLYKISFLSILIYLFSSMFAFSSNDGSRYATNSVLAKGNWYKIKINNGNNIYKLTYDDLKKIGLSDPKNVQIYGYGGWVLDESFSTKYIDDLPQVGIWMSNTKENFGSGDYILFYGRGDIKWVYNSSLKEFTHTQNTYSSESFYFVTESTDREVNLIKTENSLPKGNNVVTTYQDYYLHEKELVNIAEMGRMFFGEDFKVNNSQTFNISLPGITTDATTIAYSFVSRPINNVNSQVEFTLNNELMTSKTMRCTTHYDRGSLASGNFKKDNLGENNTLNIKYTAAAAGDKNIKLDYFRVNYTRSLKPYNATTSFRTTNLNSDIDFQISGIPATLEPLIFDVTDPLNPILKKGTKSGTNYTFNSDNSSLKEYVYVDQTKTIYSPSVVGKIANQNLHNLEVADMIIISHPFFDEYTKELAQLHLDDSGLTSLIVHPEDIYNEFSSGKPDVTAYRRFLKMFHDRSSSEDESPKYLLLFGDGTYDNRLISSLWTNDDKRAMLLTYQTEASVSEYSSYVTDDYFGFLDDNEGTNLSSDNLDIGIGRIPVRTHQEASSVLQKIKKYMSNTDPGIWQNNMTFVADDAVAAENSFTTEIDHIIDTDSYAEYIKKTHPEYSVTKIYSDAYERVQTTNGARYPSAKEAILKKLNEGTSFLSFSGHGSPSDWTHEYIMTYADIESMSNTKLPVWLTATCDFTRFDQDRTSGGEAALLNPNGGAIALVSTTRVVIIQSSEIFCTAFFKHVLDKKDGRPLRLGDIVRLTKMDSKLLNDHNKLRYLIFGDPALRINHPGSDYKIEINSINGKDAEQKVNIEALSEVVIKGSIKDTDGNIIEDFNGSIESVVLDSEQTLRTRGHINSNWSTMPSEDELKHKYLDFTNTIYSGTTNVENGEFEIRFVTPKDILYSDGYGKMNFFASNPNQQEYVNGSYTNYTVSGTNIDAVEETNAPTIDIMYLNNEKFKEGATVNSTPLFYAEISDDTGINLAGGIGHTISLTIDGKTNYDLTSSYIAKQGSHKSGAIYYQIPKLTDGKHSLQFKAWDVWNNSVTKNIEFNVSDSYKPTIYNFSIKGNPAKESTTFVFTCDTPGSSVNVKYAVYSMNGGLLWMKEEKGNALNFENYEYTWDLHDAAGNRLSPGVYICRILVSINGEESSEAQRLIILEQ